MEETLMVGVCLGCRRRRFDVRAIQVGDETRELCPKCRKSPAGAAEAVPTLVPGVDGSLNFDNPDDLTVISMRGEGAPGLIFALRPITARCGHEGRILINRYGRTKCIPCDAESTVRTPLAPAITMLLACLFIFTGCGPAPFVPAYAGEPECGTPTTVHAVLGESCDLTNAVACDCEERRTLECTDGAWAVRHWGCSGGLGVSVEREGGGPQ